MKRKKIITGSVLTIIGIGIYYLTTIITSKSTPAETKIFLSENPPQIMVFSTTYSLCGHKNIYTASADKYYRTKEDAEADNINFDVNTFSTEEITLSKTEEKYCNKHFYGILKDNMIYIYSKYSGKAEYCFEVIANRLTEEEIILLEKGINFDSKESMLSFVEDYTS